MASEPPHVLHMLTPEPRVSPFDVNMALDAGFATVIPYVDVAVGQVAGLVQDAIFSRSPKKARYTAVFIGGRQPVMAADMLKAARKAMFPPFQVSVLADPSGAFTTGASLVAVVERTLRGGFGAELAGLRVAIFGGTGPVGFTAGVIAAGEGAQVTLVGHDGVERAGLAADAGERFEVELRGADGSSDERVRAILGRADVALSTAPAGVRVLSADQLAGAGSLKVVADVNAVPPSGIEGVAVDADGVPLEGTEALAIGALAIGGLKYRVEEGLLERVRESAEPLALDHRDALDLARELGA